MPQQAPFYVLYTYQPGFSIIFIPKLTVDVYHHNPGIKLLPALQNHYGSHLFGRGARGPSVAVVLPATDPLSKLVVPP